MMYRQLKLIRLFSIKENSLLFLRKIVSYLFPNTTIARKTLKEKRVLNRFLMQGWDVSYDGSRNIVLVELDRGRMISASLRRYSSDFMVFDQILIQKEYRPLVDYIRNHKSESEIVNIIDAGANIGLTTLYLSVFFSKAKIYCIEPDSSNYDVLCKNLKLNHLNDNAIHAALWHKNERLSLSNDFRDGKDWSISVRNIDVKSDNANMIQGITIADLMMKNSISQIDILKIDIEGAERYIFSDIHSCESFLPVTKYLAMEIHDEFEIREQVKYLLGYFGFEYFFSGELIIGRNKRLQ